MLENDEYVPDDGYSPDVQRHLRNEYEYENPDYKFNGTFSPSTEYEWGWLDNFRPSVNPSSSPSTNPTKLPSKKTRSPTPKKKKKTRPPTPKPSKKRKRKHRKTRSPGLFPTDSPDGRNGGVLVSRTCSNGCFKAFDGVCDDGAAGSTSYWCIRGTDCADCGDRKTSSPTL